MTDTTVIIAWVDRDGYARRAVIDYCNLRDEVELLESLGYHPTVVGPVRREVRATDNITLKVEEEGETQ